MVNSTYRPFHWVTPTKASVIFAHIHIIFTIFEKSLGVEIRGLCGAESHPECP